MTTRNVVKQLHTPIMLATTKKKGGLLPIIDVETRWWSSFAMVNCLLTLKDLVIDYAFLAAVAVDARYRIILGEETHQNSIEQKQLSNPCCRDWYMGPPDKNSSSMMNLSLR